MQPDAFLLGPRVNDHVSMTKMNRFLEHVQDAPTGSKIPFALDVQWVDRDGEPTQRGRISGTIETIIEISGQKPVVVFSTGERISLDTFEC